MGLAGRSGRNGSEAFPGARRGGVVLFFPPRSEGRAAETPLPLALPGGSANTAAPLGSPRRRPDPIPAVFGYHELFHALVVVAAACQYAAIASFVL